MVSWNEIFFAASKKFMEYEPSTLEIVLKDRKLFRKV